MVPVLPRMTMDTFGDPRSDEKHIVAFHQVSFNQDAIQIEPGGFDDFTFAAGLRRKLNEYPASQCTDCAGCDHPFGRAADAHQHIFG